jgi:hypothetical protein
MKMVMSAFPVSTLPDFTHPFVLECEEFDEGIGTVLM